MTLCAASQNGCTALIRASSEGHLEVVRALLAAHADEEAKHNVSAGVMGWWRWPGDNWGQKAGHQCPLGLRSHDAHHNDTGVALCAHRMDPRPSYSLATMATSRWSTLCWLLELTWRPWMRWAVMSVIWAPAGGTIGAANSCGVICGVLNARGNS